MNIFSSAGIAVIRSGYDKKSSLMIFKAGPPCHYHSHEDLLSLDFTFRGKKLFTDPGIVSYEGKLTDYYRSSVAHNMILLDGKGPDFSKVTRSKNEEIDFELHKGNDFYHFIKSLPEVDFILSEVKEFLPEFCDSLPFFTVTGRGVWEGGYNVSRTIVFIDSKYWIIYDRVEGYGNPVVTVSWQTFSGWEIVKEGNMVKFSSGDEECLLVPLFTPLRCEILEGQENPPAGWVASGGQDIPAPVIRYYFHGNLPITLVMIILPRILPSKNGRIVS
jgi:hypothetical protein